MLVFYCEICDLIITRPGKATDEIPSRHVAAGCEHPLFYMDYFHPDYLPYEAEYVIRERIETFGLLGALEQVLF